MIKWFKYKFMRRPVMEMTFGELIDKRSIFLVKANRGIDRCKHREQIRLIDEWLIPYIEKYFSVVNSHMIYNLMDSLYHCNNTQFDFEDQVFELGGEEGLRAAKMSRKFNLKRAELKRKIDILFGEKYTESKKYSKLNNL